MNNPFSLEAVRLQLCEIGYRRAVKELAKRGYSEPANRMCLNPLGFLTTTPGLMPEGIYKINPDGTNTGSVGIAFVGSSWTGEWGAWGWDMDGKYWSIERKVYRREAMREIETRHTKPVGGVQ